MIRAAYSIPSNIVEGNSKRTTKDYLNFLYISRGSIHELKYFLLLSKDLYYLDEDQFYRLSERCDRVAKLLNGLINSLKEKT
jgi:four helix bundle protein